MKRTLRTNTDKVGDFGGEVAKLVANSSETTDLYHSLLKLTAQTITSTSQSLFLCERADGPLREVANNGEKADLIEFVPFDLGSGLSAWVGQEKRPVRISRSPRRSEPGAAFMAVPLLVTNQLVGVLAVSDNRRDSFTDNEQSLAENLGTQIAVGLERRLNQERLRNLTERSERAQERLAAMAGELEATKHELAKQVHAITLIERTLPSLSTIRHAAEFLLAYESETDPKARQRLEAIHTECCRARQMLEKVQQLSGHSGTLIGSAAPENVTQ